ncbi:hypothetical protein LTR91_002496 [Friedmanniomyces endolithicus]|uniref:Uncharacterized protein n=1 Tax=Friedmanniomyces endolithicus TaxID=329885 RepID=A0AAN6KY12_9PEZI|nr:hypothetical protein LTR57_009302 [Friedmanniomyces endolithicus]KAK1008576.1 hypothetical protein LTS01_002334 [Friedmanniomyces endolithicus]KAK1010661.1 hypothetical protein LTR91_002496 [Friedmanniomyces endolithicus]KAK1030095.1 hypothetical protein LTS16_019193 [Friedmanniomyces endolithicus]
MDRHAQAGDGEFIATATFRLCNKPDTIVHHLSLATSPTKTELGVLFALGENGRTSYCTFHEERESCVVGRPLSDLLAIWHPEKIEGSLFCLHMHARQLRLSDEDVRAAEREWHGSGAEVGGEAKTTVAKGAESASKKTDKGKGRAKERQSTTGGPDDSVTLRLSFLQDEDSLLDPAVWRDVNISVLLSSRIDCLPQLMKAAIIKLVTRDKPLFAMLQKGSGNIVIKPCIRFNDSRDCYVDFENGKVMVVTFAGLFSAVSEVMTIDVMVEVMGNEVETAPQTPTDAVQPFVCNTNEIFRLGNVRKKPNSTPSKASDIPHEMIVVGGLDDDTAVHLAAVPVFSVNSLLIGDCYTGVTMIAYKETYDWAEKYADATSVEDLATLVRAHRKDKPNSATQLPIRQNYSFGRFVGLEHGLKMTRWPATGVHLTVRCVNMLPADPNGEEEMIVFPALKHTRYTLEAVDNVDSVKTMIREEIRGRGKDGRTCGRLFEEEMVGKWQMVLWVLPQIDGTATLYRWLEGGAMQFLRLGTSTTGKTDGRLFIEAHVLRVERADSRRTRAVDEEEEDPGSLFLP